MTNEIAPADLFKPEELSTILANAGAIEQPSETFSRLRLEGPNFVAEDNAWQTPIKGGGPALICRIVAPPEEYQAKWFTDADAQLGDRPDMAGGKFCKSRFGVPSEAREFGTNGASCRTCIFNPFQRDYQNKCAWKGDVRVQPFPDGPDPELSGDEPIYTLTISTTGMIEWKGTASSNMRGSVSERNFIARLGQFAITNAKDIWDIDPTSRMGAEQAIMRGLGALNAGLVAAELRSLKMVNEERGREWYVPSFVPIHIEPDNDDVPALDPGLPDLGD
jgi:hypothetical protein